MVSVRKRVTFRPLVSRYCYYLKMSATNNSGCPDRGAGQERVTHEIPGQIDQPQGLASLLHLAGCYTELYDDGGLYSGGSAGPRVGLRGDRTRTFGGCCGSLAELCWRRGSLPPWLVRCPLNLNEVSSN
jgi:hypothetical protein